MLVLKTWPVSCLCKRFFLRELESSHARITAFMYLLCNFLMPQLQTKMLTALCWSFGSPLWKRKYWRLSQVSAICRRQPEKAQTCTKSGQNLQVGGCGDTENVCEVMPYSKICYMQLLYSKGELPVAPNPRGSSPGCTSSWFSETVYRKGFIYQEKRPRLLGEEIRDCLGKRRQRSSWCGASFPLYPRVLLIVMV